MKLQKKTKLFHKIWCWTSIALNSLTIAIGFYFTHPNVAFIYAGIIAFAFWVATGAIEIWADMNTNNFSGGAVLYLYICALLLSVIFVVFAYEKTANFLAILPTMIALIVESVTIVVIQHRYSIRKALINLFSKRKSQH